MESLVKYTPEQLSDIQEIREVALRYSHGVDRLDGDCMKSAYWPDATDDHGTFVGNAHEFVDHCMKSHLRWDWTMHSIYNHMIDLDDETNARGEVYNISHLARTEAGEVDTWYGRYLDRYEKRDGEWRIAHRVCSNNGTSLIKAPAMAVDAAKFRQAAFDRPSGGRPIGP